MIMWPQDSPRATLLHQQRHTHVLFVWREDTIIMHRQSNQSAVEEPHPPLFPFFSPSPSSLPPLSMAPVGDTSRLCQIISSPYPFVSKLFPLAGMQQSALSSSRRSPASTVSGRSCRMAIKASQSHWLARPFPSSSSSIKSTNQINWVSPTVCANRDILSHRPRPHESRPAHHRARLARPPTCSRRTIIATALRAATTSNLSGGTCRGWHTARDVPAAAAPQRLKAAYSVWSPGSPSRSSGRGPR